MPPAGAPQQQQLVEPVTCLGCGCACDDIRVHVQHDRIVETTNACPLGATWFGDGRVPSAIRLDGEDANLEEAIDALTVMLAATRAPLVFLAPELTCEAQRAAIALADHLHAALDTITSITSPHAILASQERGRASATLGEVRNRADVVVFWGVDPHVRYPRYWSRYAPEPSGLFVDGRKGRTIVAVDVGNSRGPDDADVRVSVDPADEVALLTALAAVALKPGLLFPGVLGQRVESLTHAITSGRYVAVVADGEPPDQPEREPLARRDPQRAAALIALAQALNTTTRCALSTLRGGGNRSGADAVLTAQTGYPMRVSFGLSFPIYLPHPVVSSADATLIVGDAGQIPAPVMSQMLNQPVAIIGPRASLHHGARVAIDTGIAGIHTTGIALRMDDVPLPLRPSIVGPRDSADVIRALLDRVATQQGIADPVTSPQVAASPVGRALSGSPSRT